MKKKLFFLLVSFVLLLSSSFAQNDVNAPPNFSRNTGTHWMFDNAMDTTNGNWIQIAPWFTSASGVMGFYWSDSDKVWCGGGFDAGGTNHAENYFYNPVNNTYRLLAPMPGVKGYGKALRVKNKLYIMGAWGAWGAPDGSTYEYTPSTNTWTTKATMPSPMCNEFATCVWQDSLIICIGGSTAGWSGQLTVIRVFDPQANTWTTLSSTFPVVMANGHAECIGNEIVEVGGYNGTGNQLTMYRGTITPGPPMTIAWRSIGNNLWNIAVYRTSGGKIGNYMIFGPTQGPQAPPPGLIWAFKITDSTTKYFLPLGPQIANRCNAVRVRPDSAYFYCFGGYNGTSVLSESDRYAFIPPAPPTQPICEAFSSTTFPPTGWSVIYTGTNYWSRATVSGFCIGTGSAEMDFYDFVSGSQQLNSRVFTPTGAGDSLIFQDAYCTYSTENDQLQILTSTNGGTSFTPLITLAGGVSGPLVTAPPQTSPFTPTCTQWKYQRLALPVGVNMVQFNAITAFGNDLYIDSIGTKTSCYPVGIIPIGWETPKVYSLSQNYPNPFNPSTKISYTIPKAGNVELKVYDVLGREVAILVNGFKQVGNYSVDFNPNNLASGVYFYSIKSGDFTATKKMLLIK